MEDSVNVLKFAECRAKEIMMLMEDVPSKEQKLSHQRLPYHMRRRAASHNPKRLPRSLRVKKTEETVAKHKKKRKYHKNLLEEYNSRQCSDSVWLPTHIWFAKRFHMKKMWGYQLPFQATGKRFRSSYRAAVNNILLQDLSYFCCIELKGDKEKILSQLSCLTDDSLGVNFASESYIDGTKEGHCFLYHPNSFPFHGIGPVSFLWKPTSKLLTDGNNTIVSNSCQQLWIWCHPSIHTELVEIFISIFDMKKENSKAAPKEYEFASKTNYMKTKLHFQQEPVYESRDVIMTILKDTLVRHRIIGPKAQSVIYDVLKPVSSSEEVVDDKKTSESSEAVTKLSLSTLKQHIWNYIKSPKLTYLIPLKTVIGLTVDDPRLYVTSKNENDEQEGCVEREILDQFSNPATSCSALWDKEIRNKVTASQIPEFVLNKEKGKYIIPEASDLRKCTTSVPVIVIHQPGVCDFGSGWDIIAPQGWGMAFWIPFIYHGAQPAGFDDLCSVNLECGLPTFPCSFPDTKAGCLNEESNRKINLEKFYKYSKAKRPNFKILGIQSPFFMPWSELITEWEKEFLNKYSNGVSSTTTNNAKTFFTMRSKSEIKDVQNICKLLTSINKHKDENIHFQEAYGAKIQSLITLQNRSLKAVVLVRIECLYRGTPSNFSGIYLPNICDLENLKGNPKYFGPVEGKHSVEAGLLPDKKKRKMLKAEVELTKTSRPTVEALVSSSHRKVIGYVSEGGYSRLRGRGYGLGHCALTGLLILLEMCENFELPATILMREQHTSQYRPATIEIVLNSL